MVDFQLQCLTTGWKGKEYRPPQLSLMMDTMVSCRFPELDKSPFVGQEIYAKSQWPNLPYSSIFLYQWIWMMVGKDRKGHHPLAYPLLIFYVGIGNPWTLNMEVYGWENPPENFRQIHLDLLMWPCMWPCRCHYLWVHSLFWESIGQSWVMSLFGSLFLNGSHQGPFPGALIRVGLVYLWLAPWLDVTAPGYEPYQRSLWGRPLPCPFPMFSKESGIPGWPENN